MKLPFNYLLLLLVLLSPVCAADDIAEARNNALLLGKTLQTTLMAAMQSGGPAKAIAVCNTAALPLTAQISEQSGWHIRRTSLKIRNPANIADSWERKQLQQFEQRLQADEPADALEVFTEQVQDGKTVQRYMKAIPVQAGCLACHGSPVPDVIHTLYPADQAYGYQTGQLRGAFSLRRILAEQKNQP